MVIFEDGDEEEAVMRNGARWITDCWFPVLW